MLIKSLENTIGKEVNYMYLYSDKIIIGHNWDGNPHTDNAGSCPVKKFWAGEFHSLIIEKFGKGVLDEILLLIKIKL